MWDGSKGSPRLRGCKRKGPQIAKWGGGSQQRKGIYLGRGLPSSPWGGARLEERGSFLRWRSSLGSGVHAVRG